MVSIFKAIKENNVDSIRDLIQLTTGNAALATIPPDRRQQFQRYLKATGQKQVNLNRRSIYGRTALHCAATWNRIDMVRLLLDCPSVNVNVQDRENGWTALHRALYCGHLAIALELLRHPDIDLRITDWDGVRPIELLMSTIGNTKPLIRRLLPKNDHAINGEEDIYPALGIEESVGQALSGGTDLYTWGSNTNYVLGHSDSENRMYPERVHLNLESQKTLKIMARPEVLVLDVRMAKYHTAVLTSEPRNNLLLCGFGNGGRLGNGKEGDTQLMLTPVHWPERIAAVALGKDHTVAITERGSVITFGSNEHCQLGYETENGLQLLPRKVQAPSLKRQAIIGAAASAVHTVVYTTMDIFTFGYNQGQLGYHASGDEIHQILPRKVAFPSPIKSVAATDYATALLFESHEIILLCNFNQQKIILPTDRFPANIRVHSPCVDYPVKIFSGGENYMGALSNNGDVFVWTCRVSRNVDKPKGKNRPLVHVGAPRRAWLAKKTCLEAMDASIGHHGDIVLSTRSGKVFVGHLTKEGSYKFSMLPNLQRCVLVSASPSGAFAAIRSEVQVDPIRPATSTLPDDIAGALPHLVVGRRLERKLQAHDRLAQRIREQDDSNATGEGEEKIMTDSGKRVTDDIKLAWLEVDDMASKDETLDAVFMLGEGTKIYCHSCILSSRSRFLSRALSEEGFVHRSFHVKRCPSRKEIHFTAQNMSVAAVLHLIDWIYTGTYAHPMGAYYTDPVMSYNCDTHPTPRDVQKDLVALATLFELDELCDSACRSFSHTPRMSLPENLLELLESGKGADVRLELKDGQFRCHEVILRQRCGFFGALFEPGSIWMQSRRERRTPEDPLLHVSMAHVTMATAGPLLRYLYGDLDEHGLFGDMKYETPDAMMQFLVEMLCLADELLLSRLKILCERTLAGFLTLRSATRLLDAADEYMADGLKDACLQFIGTNLDIFLTRGMLDHLDAQVVHDLEIYVQQRQVEEMPFGRRLSSELSRVQTDREDDELSTSLYTLSREDQPIATNYCEVYTTIIPEPSWAVKSSDEEDQIFPLDEDQPAIEDQRQNRRAEKGKQQQASPPRHIPKKMSQKERRKVLLQKQQQEQLVAAGPKPPVWGKVETPTPLMMTPPDALAAFPPATAEPDLASKEQAVFEGGSKGKKIYVAKEDFSDGRMHYQRDVKLKPDDRSFDPKRSLGPSFVLTPIRRQGPRHEQHRQARIESAAEASFHAIQKQQELEGIRIKGKQARKSLVRIQSEERAIASLKEFYVQILDATTGEWVDIDRLESL
ncbi:hypothetical protein BX666DRAFT_1857499 [Dichotomocladium elegans]|nr:hypothetical protein BX666DRAFT_1857499 [Dichotomocladium elegans]